MHADPSADDYRALGFAGADDFANMFQFKRDFERSYCVARSVGCSRELHPKLLTFAGWLVRNKSRIPVQ